MEVESRRPRRRRRPRINGVGREELNSQPPSVNVPPPATADSRAERDEQEVYRTEQLMLQGYHDPRQLMPLLGVSDSRAMGRYIKRVRSRWEMKVADDIGVKVQLALREMDLIHQRLSAEYAAAENVKDRVFVLNSIARLLEKKNFLRNISPKTLSSYDDRPIVSEEDLESLRKNKELLEMIRAFGIIMNDEQELRREERELGERGSDDGNDMPDAVN